MLYVIPKYCSKCVNINVNVNFNVYVIINVSVHVNVNLNVKVNVTFSKEINIVIRLVSDANDYNNKLEKSNGLFSPGTGGNCILADCKDKWRIINILIQVNKMIDTLNHWMETRKLRVRGQCYSSWLREKNGLKQRTGLSVNKGWLVERHNLLPQLYLGDTLKKTHYYIISTWELLIMHVVIYFKCLYQN